MGDTNIGRRDRGFGEIANSDPTKGGIDVDLVKESPPQFRGGVERQPTPAVQPVTPEQRPNRTPPNDPGRGRAQFGAVSPLALWATRPDAQVPPQPVAPQPWNRPEPPKAYTPQPQRFDTVAPLAQQPSRFDHIATPPSARDVPANKIPPGGVVVPPVVRPFEGTPVQPPAQTPFNPARPVFMPPTNPGDGRPVQPQPTIPGQPPAFDGRPVQPLPAQPGQPPVGDGRPAQPAQPAQGQPEGFGGNWLEEQRKAGKVPGGAVADRPAAPVGRTEGGPAVAGGNPNGGGGGGLNPVADATRSFIDRSLLQENTMIGLTAAGAAGGWFGSGPMPAFLDSVTGKDSLLQRTPVIGKAADFYRRNYSPSQFIADDFIVQASKLKTEVGANTEYLAKLDKGSLDYQKHAENLAKNEARLAELEKTLAAAEKGRAVPWLGGEKKWTTLAANEGKIIGEWRGDKMKNRLGEGAAVAVTAIAADYVLDKYVFGKDQGTIGDVRNFNFSTLPKDFGAHHKYYLEGPAVVAAMMLPKNTMSKVFYTVAAVGGSKALDAWGPVAPSPEYSMIMRPNAPEAFMTGAAWMAPIKDPRYRLGAVATAYVAGRAWNVGRWALGYDEMPKDQRDNVVTTFGTDIQKRSSESFNEIVEKGKKLGVENEGALMAQLTDWVKTRANENPVILHRGAAAWGTAIGEMWLEQGHKTDLTKMGDKAVRFLPGENLDCGGVGLQFLRNSYSSAALALDAAQKQKGETVAGKVIDDKEISDLNASLKRIQDKIELVYGKHDVPGCVEKLRLSYRTDISAYTHFNKSLQEQVDKLNSPDKRYMAKMHRDLAMVMLAVADEKQRHNNGEEARIMHADAVKYYTKSLTFDANAPDAPTLADTLNKIGTKIPGAITAQWSSSVNNPFGIPRKAP